MPELDPRTASIRQQNYINQAIDRTKEQYSVKKFSTFISYLEPHSILAPYSVQMQENTGHKNSEYKHFLRKGLVTWIGYIEHKDWLH